MPEKIEQELKIMPSKQLQAKLTSSLAGKTSDQVIRQIRDTFRLGEFSIEPKGTEIIEDEYFDTPDLALYASQASVRLRHVGSTLCLTVKKMRAHEPGQLERDEIETSVSQDQAKELIENGFRGTIGSHFRDLDDDVRLSPILRITNRRQNFLLKRRDEEYVMSVDQFRCDAPSVGEEARDYFEIEIEAENDPARVQLYDIKRNLRGAVDLTYSDLSKYERGIRDLVVPLRSVPGARARGVAGRETATQDAPESLSSGVLRDLWRLPSPARRLVLYITFALVVLSGAAYAVWASLPDSTKEHLLQKLGISQPQKKSP